MCHRHSLYSLLPLWKTPSTGSCRPKCSSQTSCDTVFLWCKRKYTTTWIVGSIFLLTLNVSAVSLHIFIGSPHHLRSLPLFETRFTNEGNEGKHVNALTNDLLLTVFWSMSFHGGFCYIVFARLALKTHALVCECNVWTRLESNSLSLSLSFVCFWSAFVFTFCFIFDFYVYLAP